MADDDHNKIEIEVKDDQIVDNRKKIQLLLQCRVKDLGNSMKFSDHNATDNKHNLAEFAPYEDKAFNIHVIQLQKGSQVLKLCQEASCQTDIPPTKTAWIQYAPREISADESHQIMQSESFSDFITSVSTRLDEALEEIEIVDVFKDDFEIFKQLSDSLE